MAKFGNADFEYTDNLRLEDVNHLVKQTEKWEKELNKARVKLEESKLKALFRGLKNMFKFR